VGELVNLEEYRKQKEQKETERMQEELQQLKEQIEYLIQPKYIPVLPDEEYFHWHPPHFISYQEYDTGLSWDSSETYDPIEAYRLTIYDNFDWEKS
jgi:hypothetical protein